MLPVKVCGITNSADARMAINYGARALGFIFAASPRKVLPEQVRLIVRELPPFIIKVGVFVDNDPFFIKEILKECRLDLAQLHGAETPDMTEILEGRAIKAFKGERQKPDLIWKGAPLRAVLIDAYSPETAGGTGTVFDWNLFDAYRVLNFPLILAGGLDRFNLKTAIKTARPDALDVCGGVERKPGRKDPVKLKRFLKICKDEGE